MSCVAVYQVELDQGRMKCLSGIGLGNQKELCYSQWYQEVLKPRISEQDQERLEEISYKGLQNASQRPSVSISGIRRMDGGLNCVRSWNRIAARSL